VRTDFIKTREDITELAKWLNSQIEQGKQVQVAASDKGLEAEEYDLESPRTQQQNKAIHKLFTIDAKGLNDAGQFMNVFPFKESAEIMWTKENVKENLWRPIQMAVLNHDKTSNLETHEVDLVFKHYQAALARSVGYQSNFPSRFGP